ncbi:MAG TPA: cyclic pyranopterin monophosphate synthase MoaC [Longimicrobiaceae bacterium]|nr:cyclic pyranopterin monophosphate synthase MoaC [Longimicrobiaceae bacterium]
MSEPVFTHVDAEGRPRMVDVGDKEVTRRVAVAEGRIVTSAETARAIAEGATAKGNVLVVAQIAGITGAKRTAELIPLCHPLPLTSVEVELEVDGALPGVCARATARVDGKTGVEMEALTAVSVALLTVYDMCKALDRGMRIEGIRLLRKEGGRTGRWEAG